MGKAVWGGQSDRVRDGGGAHGNTHKRSHGVRTNGDRSGEKKAKKGENAIHGSWEAAKQRREKEAAMMFAAKPQGKKIVFGEAAE